MHEAGHSKLFLWDNPEGWGGGVVGEGLRMEGRMCTSTHVADSCRCTAKTTTIFSSN